MFGDPGDILLTQKTYMMTHSILMLSLPPSQLARPVFIIGRPGKRSPCFGRKELIKKGNRKPGSNILAQILGTYVKGNLKDLNGN